MHPHPITEDDILDFIGVIPEQFEDSLDDQEKLMKILDEFESMCSVHKTFIPIEKTMTVM